MSSPSSAPWAMPERPRRWTPTAICGPAPRTEDAMPRPVSCWNRRAKTGPHRVPQASDLRKYARSHVDAKVHHVAFPHHVVLAFDPHLAAGSGLDHGTGSDQVVVGDHLGLDEPALEVGVDDAGCDRCGVPAAYRPGPGLLRAGREVGLQTQRLVSDGDQLVQPRALLPKRAEQLQGVGIG